MGHWGRGAVCGQQSLKTLNVAPLDDLEQLVDLNSRIFRDLELVETQQVFDRRSELLHAVRALKAYIDERKSL